MFSKIICLLAIFSFVQAQPKTTQEKKISQPEAQSSDTKKKNKRDPDIESLVANAQALPPEFAADFLIRIATSGKIKEKDWRLELLESAFQTAANVQYQFKRNGLSWIHTDTRTGLMKYSHEQKVEALSLRCRVVQAALQLDAQKARELFEQIPTIKLPELTCKDTMSYDVMDYYETLSDVANQAFSPDEIKREEHINLVSEKLSQINSPLQIGPAAYTIQSLKLTTNQLVQLKSLFITILKNIKGDDRSFSQAMLWGATTHNVASLIDKCEKNNISGVELLSVYRNFLVTHLTNARCADYEKFHNGVSQTVEGVLNDFVRWREDQFTKNYSPITKEEIKPAKLEGKAEINEYWQSPEAKPFLIKMKQLKFGMGESPDITGKEPLTLEQRSELKWRKQLAEFLQDFRKWRSEAEKSESDYFHQKCIILEGLNDLTPPDTSHDSVLREYLNFLSDSAMQRDNPIEWYWHVKRLITYVAKPNTKDYNDALETMASSGSPIMNVIARMEKLFKASTK